MRLKNYLIELIDMEKGKWTDIEIGDLDQETLNAVWKMYTETYKDIGLHIKSIDEIEKKYKMTYLIDNDDDPYPDCFIIHKVTKYGNKIALMGSDGEKQNKKALIKKLVSLLDRSGWFVEASEKVAEILDKNNVRVIKDEETIRKALNREIKDFNKEDGTYKRKLGNLGWVEKRLFGNIKGN